MYFQIQSSLEKTLKIEVSGTLSNLGSLRPLPKDALASMSDDRCSTATSGIYSNTDSEISISPELTYNWEQSGNCEKSREQNLGLPNINKKIGKQSYSKFPIKYIPGQRQVSRIPPPKPIRYHLQHSTTNLSKLHSTSNMEISTKNMEISTKLPKPSSRISQTRQKSASYMNINGKESHVLV